MQADDLERVQVVYPCYTNFGGPGCNVPLKSTPANLADFPMESSGSAQLVGLIPPFHSSLAHQTLMNKKFVLFEEVECLFFLYK